MLDELLWLACVIVICAALSVIGKAMDSLLLDHQAKSVRQWLVPKLDWVSRLRVADAPGNMARTFLYWHHNLFGDRFLTVRWLSVTVGLSFALTTLVLLIEPADQSYDACVLLRFEIAEEMTVNLLWKNLEYLYSAGHLSEFFWMCGDWFFLTYWKNNLRVLYPLNYVFDGLTLYVTVLLLRHFLRTTSWLKKICLIIVDGLIAYIFAVLCLLIAIYSEGREILTQYGFKTYLLPQAISDYVIEWYPYFNTYPWLDYKAEVLAETAFASTTLLPTMLYLCVLLSLIVLVPAFGATQFIAVQILRLSTETDKSIFFYAGTIAGIFVIVLQLCVEAIRIVSVQAPVG